MENIKLDTIYLNESQNTSAMKASCNVDCYNNKAGVWEPMLERTEFELEMSSDNRNKDKPISSLICNFKKKIVNLNVSDACISFLHYTLGSCWDNFFSESTEKLEEKRKISNHRIFNYTGDKLKIWDFDKKSDLFTFTSNEKEIEENSYIDWEFLEEEVDHHNFKKSSSGAKEPTILFEIGSYPSADIGHSILKIDSIQEKLHPVRDSVKPQKLQELVYTSVIQAKAVIKEVSFYSPLLLKNDTQFEFILILTCDTESRKYSFGPGVKVGVPSAMLKGKAEFVLDSGIRTSTDLLHFYANNAAERQISVGGNYFILSSKLKKSYRKVRLQPTFSLVNLLPFELNVTLHKTGQKEQVSKQKDLEIYKVNRQEKLIVQLNFLEFSTNGNITLYNPTANASSASFELFDSSNLNFTLLTFKKEGQPRKIYLYSYGILVNSTTQNLDFYYYKKKKQVKIAGQTIDSNILLLNEATKLVVKRKNVFSQPCSLKAIGVATQLKCKDEEANQQFEFIVNINLSLLRQDLNIYSYIVTVAPKFVIVNELDSVLVLTNSANTVEKLVCRPKERKEFFFFGLGEKTWLKFSIQQGEEGWQWSSLFQLGGQANSTALIQRRDKKKKLYVSVQNKIDQLLTYTIFSKATFESACFVIENKSKQVSMQVKNNESENSKIFVDVRSKSLFDWRDSGSFTIDFFIGNLESPLILPQNSYKFKFREQFVEHENEKQAFPFEKQVKLFTGANQGFMFNLTIISEGAKKKLTVTDWCDTQGGRAEVCSIEQIQLNIAKLGVSLISEIPREGRFDRREIIYLTMRDINVFVQRNANEEKVLQNIQLRIKGIQADNQINHISQYPILMRNEPPAEDDTSYKFINFVCLTEMNKFTQSSKILKLHYLIQAFELHIDGGLLEGIFEFSNNLSRILKTTFTGLHFVFKDSLDNLKESILIKESFVEPIWLTSQIQDNDASLMIHQLSTSPMEIRFSFEPINKSAVLKEFLNTPLLRSITATLANVQDAPLKLNGASLENIYGQPQAIFSQVLGKYKNEGLVQIFKLFGSIDILGNPVSALSSISTGFSDFFEKPIKGMVKGPLEGVKGAVDGSFSLVKHTIDGTFGVAGKLTGGISKGLLSLTLDDDFIEKHGRNKVINKPSNFIEGIGYGLVSMADSTFSGVTDVVMKPIEGAKEDDLAGFGKGILKGMASLVVKPISGILDVVSFTSEGIKNTLHDDDLDKKIRKPRPFYGRFKFVPI